MGRPRNTQGAERTDLSPTQTEAAEGRFLPPGEMRSDAAEASCHLKRSDLEVGAGRVPASEQSIGCVIHHPDSVTHRSP
jgi:hypothetical protein